MHRQDESDAFKQGRDFELGRLVERVSAITCVSEEGKRIRNLVREYAEYRKAVWRDVAILEDQHRPKVVCLCGSTRFYDAFQRANYDETMAGNIVLSVGFYMHSEGQVHGQTIGCTPEQKEALDQLHMRKIDLADEVLVLNVGGYYGESTQREIKYAETHGKPIRWLEANAISNREGR